MKSSRFATKPERPCILLVPELGSLLRESAGGPAFIRRLLRRRPDRELDESGFHGELVTGRFVPPAALTRRLDCPDDARGCWLRADPVEVSPDLGAVWMRAGAQMDADAEAASKLVELFAEEGLELDFPTADRGYIRLQQAPECRFSPPWALAGESLEHLLPTGRDARRWRRLLNESQVLLHQHRRDRQAGQAPGSLWFWGGGALPERDGTSVRVSAVFGDDLIARALADWLDLEHGPASPDEPARPGMMMIWPFDYREDAATNLARLDAWMRRAWRRLRLARGLKYLEIADESGCWRFTTADAWRVWR